MLWRVMLDFRDRDGNTGRCSSFTTSAATTAALVGFANVFGGAVQALSSAVLVGATVSANWSYAPGPSSDGSDVKRRAVFVARNTADLFSSFSVPSVRSGLLTLRDGVWQLRSTDPGAVAVAPILQAHYSFSPVNAAGTSQLYSTDWLLAELQ